jgi:hypothetical protein
VHWEARGGLVGSLALCQRNLMTVTPPHSDPQCVISHVYGYAECAPRLMLSEHRERFLSQNSRYRVYCLSQAQKDDMDVDAAMAVLFPEELRELPPGNYFVLASEAAGDPEPSGADRGLLRCPDRNILLYQQCHPAEQGCMTETGL